MATITITIQSDTTEQGFQSMEIKMVLPDHQPINQTIVRVLDALQNQNQPYTTQRKESDRHWLDQEGNHHYELENYPNNAPYGYYELLADIHGLTTLPIPPGSTQWTNEDGKLVVSSPRYIVRQLGYMNYTRLGYA